MAVLRQLGKQELKWKHLQQLYPYNAPDLGICDVYRRGTVVLCNNGVVSEVSVKNNRLVAKNIS